MRQLIYVSILFYFFSSCAEETIKPVEPPISSTNSEAIRFFNEARLHEQKYELIKAREDYQSAVKLDPNFILAHINLFRENTVNTSWIDLSDKNIEFLESIITKGTEYEKTLFEMYKIPFMRNDTAVFNKRLGVAQKLVDLYPESTEPLILLAEHIPNYTSIDDWRILRSKSLSKVLEIDPNNVVASEAIFFLKYGGTPNSTRFRSDIDFYNTFDSDAQKLIKKFPNSPRVLRRVANIYRNSYDYVDPSRYQKSLESFDKLISLLQLSESSFINDVLKSKGDLLINIGRREECYKNMKLAIDSSKSLNKKIESTFELFTSYISGGDYLKAIKEIDKFDQVLDEGLFDSDGNEISRKIWLKCKVGLNLYKSIIYAHANQSERAKISFDVYKGYAKETIDFNQINTDKDYQKYYSQDDDLSQARVRWKSIHPNAILNNEAWISVLIGDDNKSKEILDNLPDNSMWMGIHTVIKGDFSKGLEILSKHNNFYSQYFKAQALIGLGKIEDSKIILDNLRYIPFLNFDTSWTKNRAARLYETL